MEKLDALPWGGSLHKVGVWFRLPLREPLPALLKNSGVDPSSWHTPDGNEYITAWHSSSFYSFSSTMQEGLRPGSDTKSSLVGVYMYPTDDGRHARASSGYRVYSTFFNDGLFWSVVYECRFGKFLSTTQGKMSAGNCQIAARKGSCHMVAAWFHVVHISEMPDCEKARLTINADTWNPAYEIVNPTE